MALIPTIVKDDWVNLNRVLRKLASIKLGSGASPTFSSITLSGLTASRLINTDASKTFASVADLTTWIAGTTNQIAVADDSDGTVTLSTPQNIHTGASPTFAGLTIGDANFTYSAIIEVLSISKAVQINASADVSQLALALNFSPTPATNNQTFDNFSLLGIIIPDGSTTGTKVIGYNGNLQYFFSDVANPSTIESMKSFNALIYTVFASTLTITDAYGYYVEQINAVNGNSWGYYNASTADNFMGGDNVLTMWGTTNTDGQISSDGTNLIIDVATALRLGNNVTNYLEVKSDGDLSFVGTAQVASNMPFENAKFPIFDKASGNGIKVDTATPTFGFADLIGDQFSKNTGGTKPTLTVYNGDVDAWQFANGDEAFMTYHIPHDNVAGTDIHLHIHWSQNAAGATGGTIDFKYTAIYAKGHNQDEAPGSFTSTPITAVFSSIDINDGGSGLNRYQQHLTEVTISAATATAALFDKDNFEPDGVIELTLEMTTTNLTGTPSLPFIHYVDIHYQTTGLIGTKSRTPDFYA